MKEKRYYLIDAFRGFAILNMIFYHFSYDLFIVFGINPHYLSNPLAHIWQQFICWSFIITSGFVWQFGAEKNLRRGIIINIWGLLITVVTCIFIPTEAIFFGILNFIGCAILIMLPLRKALNKINPFISAVISLILFALFYNIDSGYISLFGFKAVLPDILYTSKILTPLGFPFDGFRSSDYFPILPWIFLYIFGFCCGRIFMSLREIKKLARPSIPLLSYLGRKSLVIYILHQPVCIAVAAGISAYITYCI